MNKLRKLMGDFYERSGRAYRACYSSARLAKARAFRWCTLTSVRSLAIVVTLVSSIGPAAASGVATLSKPAPAFDLETPAGGDVTLHSFAGRPLVMNVFASWCPPCREELPRIVSAAHSAKSRVAFLGVDEQEAEQIATTFAKQMHLPYPIGIDNGQFAASYGAGSLPETIFVDAHGIVRAIVHGTISAELLAKNLAQISR